jgi:hypothetical protein
MVAAHLPLDAQQRAHAARVRREQPQHRAPPRVPCRKGRAHSGYSRGTRRAADDGNGGGKGRGCGLGVR